MQPLEGSCDRGLVVEHGELVMQLVAAGKAVGCRSLFVAVVSKDLLRDAQDLPDSISQNPSHKWH